MLRNIIRRTGSTEHNIIRRQTAMYKHNQKRWINQAKSILSKYELPSIYELLDLHLQRKRLLALSSCSNKLPLKYTRKRPALSDCSNKQSPKRTCKNITATLGYQEEDVHVTNEGTITNIHFMISRRYIVYQNNYCI